jgi:hypothetical protein
MALRRRRELERRIDELEKASRVPPGARSVSDLVSMVTRARGDGDLDLNSEGRPLPRPESWRDAAFGPDWPLPPELLDPARPDTQLPEPRIWQYPVSENLRYFNERHVGWETLKRSADSPLFRACIEIRKTELSTLDWVIRVSPEVSEQMARQSRKSKETVEQELRQKYEAEIKRVSDFWQFPDRRNGRDFAEWVAMLLEEQLVWDALAIYPRRTYGGDLLDLMIIDGSTIKPLLDAQGGRPEPPAPAYQQLLYGFPRGEFTADALDIDGESVTPGGLEATQLIYRRRVSRTWTPYGYSPTEQALLDGLLYNKRFEWMLAEYTEGAKPSQWIETTESDWTARQILEYERAFNDRYSGQTAERHRYSLLPTGMKPHESTQVPERYKADYDLHLIKLVCMHYAVTMTELGFTETGGLGSTGYHEGQEDVNYRKGRLPDVRWFGALLTQISHQQLGLPPELEFAFLGLEEEDEAAMDQVMQNRVSSGRMTLNEDRTRLGLPAYNFAEADMPMVETARGVVFLDGASETVPPGVLIEPASEKVDDPDATLANVGQSPTQRRPVSSGGGTAKSVQDEIQAYKRWHLRHQEPGRKFRFEHLTEDMAKETGISFANVEFAKAGGPGPKVTPSSGQPGSKTSSWSPYSRLS